MPEAEMVYDINDVNSFNVNITDALYKYANESCGCAVWEEADNHLDPGNGSCLK